MSAQTIPFVVIPCGGSKLETAAPAAELYTGSMFKDALNTARTMTTDDNIRILSALHGLIKLSDIVAPYDVKMGSGDDVSDSTLRGQLEEITGGPFNPAVTIQALLPKKYDAKLQACRGFYPITNHLTGCAGIGYQKAKLKQLRTASLNKKEGI